MVPMASSALATTWEARARFGGVCHFGFEEFGVGEDDAQLVVQAVEQEAEFW